MQPERRVLPISYASDVSFARDAARSMAQEIGFDATASEEIALAVGELASNLVKHAGDGRLFLLPLLEGERIGIQIESHDHGPGIENVDQALTDGFSTAGSLGYGLGAVNRLMDELEIIPRSLSPDGAHIICKRFIRMETASVVPVPLEFGAASRAHPLMDVNGDAFVIKQWSGGALIGIIDGLGHGQYALRAAQTARQYVESHYDQPLDALFGGVDRACRATRGVVMALARFDWQPDKSNVRLAFASIGNVEVRVTGKHEPMNFVIRRGILGVNAPSAVVTEHRWNPGCLMVLHSDGVSSNWNWSDIPDLSRISAQRAAQRLVQRWAKDADDATAVVAQSAIPQND